MVVGEQVLDFIVVVLPICDIRDTKGPNRVRAKIMQEGQGIEITMPSASHFISNISSTQNIYLPEGNTNAIASSMQRHHLVAANNIKRDVRRQTKKTNLFFPNGIKCVCVNHLESVLSCTEGHRVVNPAGGSIQLYNIAVYWKMIVASDEERLLQTDDADNDDEILKAFQRTNI